MTRHSEPDTETLDKEIRKRRNKLLLTGGSLATIAIAVPITWGWIANAVEISKLPGRINTVEMRQQQQQEDLKVYQAKTDQKLEQIVQSQERIEAALRIAHSPKDTSP